MLLRHRRAFRHRISGNDMADDTPGLGEKVLLREVTQDDLPIFFEQQLDPAANYMSAFTAKDPTDKDAFTAHWARILDDPTGTIKPILFDGRVAGYVASYVDQELGKPEVCYWLGKEYWGKGLATRALSEFLGIVKA